MYIHTYMIIHVCLHRHTEVRNPSTSLGWSNVRLAANMLKLLKFTFLYSLISIHWLLVRPCSCALFYSSTGMGHPVVCVGLRYSLVITQLTQGDHSCNLDRNDVVRWVSKISHGGQEIQNQDCRSVLRYGAELYFSNLTAYSENAVAELFNNFLITKRSIVLEYLPPKMTQSRVIHQHHDIMEHVGLLHITYLLVPSISP